MASYQHIPHGFDPVFDEHSRILVLGSFPSVLSRKNAFYYGNPQNRFWRVMASCLDAPVPPNEGDPIDGEAAGGNASDTGGDNRCAAPASNSGPATLEQSIAAKRQLLLSHGIALWDVIESCDIKGSSDASIKNVVPAHVERILKTAHIGAVICNGGTAGRLYKRYLQWQVRLAAHVLPSTSPANAAWSLERLTQRWHEELSPLLAAAKDGTLGEVPSPSSIKRSFVTARVAAGAATDETAGDTERIEYATVRVPSPAASSYAVHKSMQGNKRKDTKPELLVREKLREAGLGGYRLQWKVPGHPDIAWPGKRVALEIRGCYWHRCPHCSPSVPKKNVSYWEAKFARNMERDAENLAALKEMGWRVHVVWECELKKKTLDATMAKLLPELARELGKPLAASEEAAATEISAAGPDGTATHENPEAKSGNAAPDESTPKPHFMYVLECGDGSLYTGYTTDVQARLAAHRAGKGAKYTRNRGPLNLLAQAEFATKHDALSAEARFKRLTRDQKDALLAQASKPEADFAGILKESLGI